MSYKRHKPVSEEEMERNESFESGFSIDPLEPIDREEMHLHRWDGHHTVCQTIREIYRSTNDPEIKLKCRLALAMTKAMHEQLKKYKAKEAENGMPK
jgi:hypothetical protein